MFSTVRRQKRPLGFYQPESRLELQMEKATFRLHSEILRNMCDKQMRQRQTQQMIEHGNLPLPSRVSQMNISAHLTNSKSYDNMAPMPPEIRWLLTRSARMQRANNAGFSKFRNPVKVRIVSANGRRGHNIMSLERQRSMCSRFEGVNVSEDKRLQCDVLGPDSCTDCTKEKSKQIVLKKQRKDFPRLECHTRSLVAPDKVEKIYLNHPKELFHPDKKYACGCVVDPKFEITTPIVYTPHEVFERIRRRKNIERGQELIRQENELLRRHNNTPTKIPLYEEKTEPPLDMKISVTFRADGLD